jgi:flavorubredoxin
MDHSGCLPAVIERVRPERILASAKGAEALQQHFHFDHEIEVVPDGGRRELGGAHLRFLEARMLHWPDSMFTFLEDDGILFSNDGFGMHLASEKRFVDELEPGLVRYEAAKYYANILLPFGKVVSGALKKMEPLRSEVRLIAPDHGPVWRQDIHEILDLYAAWTLQRPSRKVVVPYATMWQSTALMARAVGEGLAAGGADVKLMPLGASHRSDVAVELLEAGGLVVGSPTLNGQVYPTVADVMTYLKGLKPKNLVGASFGSFGWSGEAVRQLDKILTDMGVELVGEGVQVQYVPDRKALLRCRSLGSEVAAKLEERVTAAVS